MIRRLGEEKAKKGRVRVFVDKDENVALISGNNNEVTEAEILVRSLIVSIIYKQNISFEKCVDPVKCSV